MGEHNVTLYEVYQTRYVAVREKNHHSIYIETDKSNMEGILYHVVGNLRTGMKIQIMPSKNPERFPSVESQLVIGCVGSKNILRFEELADSIPAPKPQLYLGGQRIYPSEPLRTCQEWVDEVLQASKLAGIIGPPKVD